MVIWDICGSALPEVLGSNLAFQFCQLVGLAGAKEGTAFL